jgi:hypothetical protein
MEIIIKLQHQGYRISEVPIPTYYRTETCYVIGMRYPKMLRTPVYHYKRTAAWDKCFPEFFRYFVHYPPKQSVHSIH